jgi:uncharacterized protein YdhG (YjbR/CyaY superfamily)
MPNAVETIKYGMPAYAVEGRAVASFAGWKTHYAVYIVPTGLFTAIARDLVGREATKGIIRFALDESVPEAVVRRLAAWSPADGAVTEKTATRKTAPKKTATRKTATRKTATKKTATKKTASLATTLTRP